MATAVLQTSLGSLSLVSKDDALVAVHWGGRPVSGEDDILAEAAHQLAQYFAGRRTDFDLPLRFADSPFREAVWHRLQEIPFAATTTYGHVARSVGGSPLAVGGACGCNPFAIIVPCHRVLGIKGRLTGYSGGAGIATKDALLALERRAAGAEMTPDLPLFHHNGRKP